MTLRGSSQESSLGWSHMRQCREDFHAEGSSRPSELEVILVGVRYCLDDDGSLRCLAVENDRRPFLFCQDSFSGKAIDQS